MAAVLGVITRADGRDLPGVNISLEVNPPPPGRLPSWGGFFRRPIEEGWLSSIGIEILTLSLADGRSGRALVTNVQIEAKSAAQVVQFTGDGGLLTGR